MRLSTGETCRKCKPDTGACAAHLHLDPCYQANVVKPQAAKLSKFVMRQCCDRFKNEDHAPECGDTPVRQAAKPSPLPLPWYSGETGGGHQGVIVEEQTGRTVALTYDPRDAEPIARAVNSHAGLVAAGRAVIDAFAKGDPQYSMTPEEGAAINALLAALPIPEAGEEV